MDSDYDSQDQSDEDVSASQLKNNAAQKILDEVNSSQGSQDDASDSSDSSESGMKMDFDERKKPTN